MSQNLHAKFITLARKGKEFFSKGDKFALINAKFLWIALMNGFTYALSHIDTLALHLFRGFTWNLALFFMLFYLCSLLGKRFYQIALNAAFWASFVVSMINLFLFINFNALLDPVALQIFFATNTREAGEFLGMYANIATLICLVAFVALSILAYFLKFAVQIPKRFCALIALACFAPLMSNFIKANYNLIHTTNKTQLLHFVRIMSQSYAEQVKFIKEYRKLNKELNLALAEKLADKRERERDEILRQSNSYISQTKALPKIVLIIGESTQRNYMQIYGYPLPTTPHLDKLVKSQNLFIFDDIISPQTHTSYVLEKLLTFANYENNATPWYKQMNIIDAMNLLDYQTIWLSNQEQISVYGNVAEVIAKRAKVSRFSNSSLSEGFDNGMLAGIKDEVLLQMYDDLNLKTKNPKQFFIFHLMGTHGGYSNRYPKEYEKFNAEILRENGLDKFYTKNAKALNNSQLQTRAEYANAVFYNDYVVSKIMKKFADDEVIVFYLSDHCDEVFDYRDFVGHTWTYVSRYMVEIPFMIYMSDKFKLAHPEILAKVEKAKHQPFMTDNFMHAFLDLLGIDCVELDKSLSLFNDEFNASRARIVGGKDYDKELKEPENSFLAPDKIYLHRTDELQKVEDFFGTYQNFEIDAHFFDDEMAKKVGKNSAYFDVGHDGLEHSIGLNLKEMVQLIKRKESEFIAQNDKIHTTSKIWLDFKNLNATNSAKSLQELIKICGETSFERKNIIVESGNYKELAAFKQSGFYTSYYVPYYDEKMLKAERE